MKTSSLFHSLFFISYLTVANAFHAPRTTGCALPSHILTIRGGSSSRFDATKLFLVDPAIASLFAGSLAGAIGVGVAYPFDSVKTKTQLARNQPSTASIADGTMAISKGRSLGLFESIAFIYEREGIAGFFSGVKGAMFGQAIIKAVAFAVNDNALTFLKSMPELQLSTVTILLIASCLSGFVTSFVVTPIERIKVRMQATGNSVYRSEWDCLQTIVRTEGYLGLMNRGLGTTLLREVPSYGIYFLLYGVLAHSALSMWIPRSLSPLLFGALSGMASWLPVYPIDVVKTSLQNTEGNDDTSAAQTVQKLYRDGGVSIFFDGLDAKMVRAATNHAVTFFVYDFLMNQVR